MSHYYSFKIFSRFWLVKTTPGAHHPEPPSPIYPWVNLCSYLSIFRNCGAFRFARTICYTVQYNTIRHSTTQLNTKQYNIMHYTICFLGNLSQPVVKTVLKALNTKQYNTMHYTICFLGNLSWPGVKTVLKAYCIVHFIVLFCVKLLRFSYCDQIKLKPVPQIGTTE